MSDFWFKPKTHGYGAAPANWKGWAAISVVVVGNLALMAVLLLWPMAAGTVPSIGRFVLFLLLDTLLVLGFLAIARRKTDGEWRWRWGRK